MNKNYFETPKQVRFFDSDNPGAWSTGIAYQDKIICCCCGGIFEIEEVIELAREAGVVNAIYSYCDWVNIVDAVSGGELPDGLSYNENDSIVEDCVSSDSENVEYETHYFKIDNVD